MESGVNAGSGAPCSYPQSWGTVPMLHYGVRRSVLVNLDLEVRVCFQQSLLHCPQEPSADSLIPSNQSTTFIQTFISCHLDPLIKLPIIHHQFESIHPFYDGNGWTGRIINILYLVANDLLDLPILYLSRYINHNKADYYRLI